MIRKYFVGVIAIFVIIVALAGCSKPTSDSVTQSEIGPSISQSNWEGLAKALTVSGAKLYGAAWCSHCKQQKQAFGEAVKYLPYVECSSNEDNPYQQTKACEAAGIVGYPTWTFADGSRHEGVMTFDQLAAKIKYQPAT